MTRETESIDPDEPVSKGRLFVDFLKHRFWDVIIVLAGILGIALVMNYEPAIPRFWYIFGLAFGAGGIPVGYLAGSKVVSLLYNPRRIWLIDLDTRVLDGGIFRFAVDEFRDLEVTDESGNTDADYSLTQLTDNLYVGKQVDVENSTVVGTWRGTLDDVELARTLAAVKRCRGELQDKAQRGWAIETAAPAIVSNALRSEVDTLMDTIEAGTLPDEGDGIGDAIEERLDDLGFDDHLEEVIEEFEPDPGDKSDPDPFEELENGTEPDQPTPATDGGAHE
ncbi:hypothetical protein [Halorubrum sp. DTA98]|uniref:hypothetical protein n=1 Tax=Halorubrum sp. DTA98 TaxID=3402163 RepID=UPI003AB01212